MALNFRHIEAVNITINQNIIGLVGKNDTHLTCTFTKDINQILLNVAIIARNKNGIFLKNEPVAIFRADKEGIFPPSGDYLSGRVTLTNITKVSTRATLRFDNLECEDEKDYMCIAYYINDFGVFIIDESEPTSILVKAFPSMPGSISYVVIASIEVEKEDNNSTNVSKNRNNVSLSTNRNSKSSIYITFTDTVTLTPTPSTEKSVPSFREGEIIQFTCMGNIGKPPGKFVWQIIPQHGEPIVYSNETTVVFDQIPKLCSFRGTSNLTVEISADHVKAKFRCYEESQADVLGMFVETEPLDVFYTVRHVNITKQPNQADYDRKTSKITLTCKGDGNPQPTYKWFRLENTSSILSSTNLYIIEDVIQNNSGVYICEAYNTIDDVEYIANYSVQINIVDKLWSSKESDSLKNAAVHVVYVILVIFAVVIGALVVRKYYYKPANKKKRTQNCCQKLMDCSMKCNDDSNVKTIAKSTIPLTKLESGSDDNKERENHSRSRNKEESRSQNLDDSFISCHGITFDPEYTPVIFINNTVKSGDLEDTFDVDNTITENKINRRSNGEEKNLVTTVDINPILEATSDSIYADPCDKIKYGHVSDETDIDINV
ncbi:immunoglobulin superfamily member 11-like [Mytilus edulis]|uniref:immunoglobulin superfamily member 11-like n=1 Tax=Mytilus edulis TaxID=6550 RepID=UPI0039F08691